MKRDKAFLEIGGETFLSRAVKILAVFCQNRVKIVLSQSQTHFVKKLPAEIPYILDFYENRGALGGIHAALRDCETQYAMILAVDLPLMTSEAIEKLGQTAVKSENFAAVVPRQLDGRLQPLCAVYRVNRCLSPLEIILSKNRSASARDFLETVQTKIIDAATLGGDENLLANINFPRDFTELTAREK